MREGFSQILGNRDQTDVDPRTFVSDRLSYINELIRHRGDEKAGLDEIIDYALGNGGKRLRPALTLMLAESLAVDRAAVEPLLRTIELFHTSSLVFDDLPAQDNAQLRRGKPTAHTVFDEGRVQLAGISMISTGFGEVAELGKHFPPDRVLEALSYLGSVLGPQRLCQGQDMDLQMEKSTEAVAGEDILKMYELKTSTMIEAALIPLMMLLDRPTEEIELLERYSYHAGIVFQLRDDVLDITSSSEELGKDADNDGQKTNIARLYGLDEAERLMQSHLEKAERCCEALPFNTSLLKGIAQTFATRRK